MLSLGFVNVKAKATEKQLSQTPNSNQQNVKWILDHFD